jgi:crotonobetainyl-CoA:carnitine CoA-transferase CaiB-like acyl-CoA transferase
VVAIMNGIRVVEVASWTYVPMAGGVLAEWGADVLKVEHPESGDPQRGLVTSGLVPAGNADFVMEHPNRGKRSVGIDIETSEGRDLLVKMVERADVFLTSFLPKVRGKLKIDLEDIRAINPNIIYVRGSSAGPKGDEADRGGYDASHYWARGGSADTIMTSDMTIPPTQPGAAYGDSMGGLTIAGGIAAALFHRERTGEALTLDCSLLSMGMWSTSMSIAGAAAIGIPKIPTMGHNDVASAVVNIYRTKDDRYVSLVLLQAERLWPELAERLGHPELLEDPRFKDNAARTANKADWIKVLEEAFAELTLDEWKAKSVGMKGVWAPVQMVGELPSDPQVVANGYVRDVVGPDGNLFKLVATPVQFNEEPATITRGPAHGEHTDEVLTELGLDMDAIIDLKIKGAVL